MKLQKEKPTIFSTPMIIAEREGRKSMTRRTRGLDKINKKPNEWDLQLIPDEVNKDHFVFINDITKKHLIVKSPFGGAGDLLWIKETHYLFGEWVKNGKTKTGKQKWTFKELIGIEVKPKYFDNPPYEIRKNKERIAGWYKRPSIFMPRKYARIFLEIINIKVERLQDITEEDAKKEGIWGKDEPYQGVGDLPTDRFQRLWNSLNEKRGFGWDKNPYCWCISFRRVK